MNRIVIILSVIFVLSGCCSQKLLNTSTTDSIRVEIRDRIVHIRDTVTLEVPVEIERVVTRDTISHLETSFASSDASIDSGGYLHHSLANKAGKRPVGVKTEVIVRDSIVYRDRKVINTVEVEREESWWQRTQRTGFWVLLSILVVIVGLKLKKFIL